MPLTLTFGAKSSWAAGDEEQVTVALSVGHRDPLVAPSAHGTSTVRTAGLGTSTSAIVPKKEIKDLPVLQASQLALVLQKKNGITY